MGSISTIGLNAQINIRDWDIKVFETSASGNKIHEVTLFDNSADSMGVIEILPNITYQTITGFGGSFTKSSAVLLSNMSRGKRKEILEAYFGDKGARYSLTRTHINSCDFSPFKYCYAQVPGDVDLNHFSIEEDKRDLIPMIREAQSISVDGFKIISSPWTAPPWMKSNNEWVGGKLLPEYYSTWARYFFRYLEAYQKEDIDIWGVTVENEPLGNNNNWESMHFTPQEMVAFVKNHLGPTLRALGKGDVKILGFDQNRGELREWADAMYENAASGEYISGTAVHWYGSTSEHFPEALQYVQAKAPGKHLIQTEACIDAEVPRWKDDDWYWSEDATDWGFNWAPADQKWLHPRYTPVYRYASDIIGCLNNHVDGWIDWNMVLDRQGGPNWAKNWCNAPVIVDPEKDEIYFTPLYFVLSHFSRFIRPGAKRIGFSKDLVSLEVTAARNPDGSLVAVVLNKGHQPQCFSLSIGDHTKPVTIQSQAIQTIMFQQNPKYYVSRSK